LPIHQILFNFDLEIKPTPYIPQKKHLKNKKKNLKNLF
jgi:hypothetical protein